MQIDDSDLQIDVYRVERSGRPGREHHRLGGAHHPQAHRRSSWRCRTSAASCRTGPGRCRCCAPGCSKLAEQDEQRRRAVGRAARPRSAAAAAARRSARTTTRRTGSPTTASGSRLPPGRRPRRRPRRSWSTRWPPTSGRRCRRLAGDDVTTGTVTWRRAVGTRPRRRSATGPAARWLCEVATRRRRRRVRRHARRARRRSGWSPTSMRCSPGRPPANRCSTSSGSGVSAASTWRSTERVLIPRPETELVAGRGDRDWP